MISRKAGTIQSSLSSVTAEPTLAASCRLTGAKVPIIQLALVIEDGKVLYLAIKFYFLSGHCVLCSPRFCESLLGASGVGIFVTEILEGGLQAFDDLPILVAIVLLLQ